MHLQASTFLQTVIKNETESTELRITAFVSLNNCDHVTADLLASSDVIVNQHGNWC